GNLVVVDIDIISELTETLESDVTMHPIEDGSAITDHVILKPNALRIEVKQGEYPATYGTLDRPEGVALSTVELTPRETNFSPSGLLFVLEGVEGAITSLFGLAAGGSTIAYGGYPVQVKSEGSRITELQLELFRLRQEARPLTVAFLG